MGEGVAARRHRKLRDRRRLSDVLQEIAAGETERLTVGQLRDALGRRSYGALLLLLALLNLLPLPPGAGIVLALMVIVVSAQLVWGRPAPYIPRRLSVRSFKRADLKRALERLLPSIRAAERIMKPRLLSLQGPLAGRATGFVCLLLGLVLVIPMPFGGNWPPALAIAVLSLAYLARDGVVTLIGLAASAAALAVMGAILSSVAGLLLN